MQQRLEITNFSLLTALRDTANVKLTPHSLHTHAHLSLSHPPRDDSLFQHAE